MLASWSVMIHPYDNKLEAVRSEVTGSIVLRISDLSVFLTDEQALSLAGKLKAAVEVKSLPEEDEPKDLIYGLKTLRESHFENQSKDEALNVNEPNTDDDVPF